jgi:hypothetical protein
MIFTLAAATAATVGGASASAASRSLPVAAAKKSKGTTPKGKKKPPATSFAKLQSCLKAHGVTGGFGGFGRPGTGGSSTTISTAQRQKMQKLLTGACKADVPKGGFGGGGFARSPQLAAYRNCLKEHGDTATSFGGRGPGQPGSTVTSTTTAAEAAAIQACAALRPTFRAPTPAG